MSLPIVSVVIPTYNQAHFLREALETVLSQTLTNLEVIVVNNYSTDDTKEVALSFNDPRLRFFDFKNQGRIAASRNVGIREAKGEWIAFLDSDDLWLPQKLARSLEILRGGYDLLAHGQIFFDDESKKEKEIFFGPQHKAQYLNMLFGSNPISTSTVVMRTQLARDLGGFREHDHYITAEDYDLWLRLARDHAKIYLLDEILGKHRKHQNSSSSSLDRHIEAQRRVVLDHYQELSPHWMHKFKLMGREAILEYSQARFYQGQGQRLKSWQHYFRAWSKNPFYWKTYLGPFVE